MDTDEKPTDEETENRYKKYTVHSGAKTLIICIVCVCVAIAS